MDFCRYLLMFCVLWSICVAAPGPNFNHSNFAVWFDLSMNDLDRSHAYSIEEFTPLISKIATKFTRIMAPYYYTLVNISSAIATFNKLERLPQQPPLELIYTIPLSASGIQFSSFQTNFEMAKKLADEANIIFPRTVKRLVVRQHSLSTGLAHTKASLANIYRGFDHSKYILGADFTIEDCGGSSTTLPTYLTQFLPYFKEVTFAIWPDYEKTENGPFALAQYVSKAFERCVEKMEKENGAVSVGFSAGWYKASDEDNPQQSLHLVQYWELMNQLAIKLNKTAILFEAFDCRHRPIRHRQQGWWKIVQNGSNYNSSQCVFEEKWEAVPHLLPAKESKNDDEINSTLLDITTSFPDLTTAPPDSTSLLTESTTTYPEMMTFGPDLTTKKAIYSSAEGVPSQDLSSVEDEPDGIIFDSNLLHNSSLKTSSTSTSTIDWKTLTVASATVIILIATILVVLYFCRLRRRKNTSSAYEQIFFRS